MSSEVPKLQPAQARRSPLVGSRNAISKFYRPIEELTTAVDRENLERKLAENGFLIEGNQDLSHITRGRSFVWQVHSGSLTVPKFPNGENIVNGVVAISSGNALDSENEAYVFGRFARDPIPRDEFGRDLRIAYRTACQSRVGLKETAMTALKNAANPASGVLLLSAGALMLMGESGVWGWPAGGSILSFIGGVLAEDKATALRGERVKRELAKIKAGDQYFAGPSVGSELDYLRSRGVTNMVKRALYHEVRAVLGDVDIRSFREAFNLHLLFDTFGDQVKWVAEYGEYRDGKREGLSEDFKGTVEILIGSLRRKLALQDDSQRIKLDDILAAGG